MYTNDTTYDGLRLCNQVCFPLYACSKELVRQYGPHLRRLGLTYTQYLVMMVLWEHSEVTSRELAGCLHLDYGTLTPVLKRMEQAGLLVRQRSKADERTLDIAITPQGTALRDRALDVPTAIAATMGLTAEEFAALYALTYKALAHMEGRGEAPTHA